MTTSHSTLPSVLLDADVIIEAHKLGIWDKLLRKFQVYSTATIIRTESYWYRRGQKRIPIVLLSELNTGKIREIEVDAGSVTQLLADIGLICSLDIGESEALAAIRNGKIDNALFCTMDKAAAKALAYLGLDSYGISFENLLKRAGIKIKLEHKYKSSLFEYSIREGRTLRVQNIDFTEI